MGSLGVGAGTATAVGKYRWVGEGIGVRKAVDGSAPLAEAASR